MSAMKSARTELAMNGAEPAKRQPDPPMYPGGMSIDAEEEQAVIDVIRSKRLFRFYGPDEGPSKVAELEAEFADFMGVKHAVAVTSGTAALTCGLKAIGVGPGDEVIVPAYTWIASAAAVISAGAIPIVTEVDESLLLDPSDVESKITPYTRAIMPVHMRGAPCRMPELTDIAKQHGLKIIEDTAQADGASLNGQRLGTFGDVGCFSLQFNKIITSGEGGMVVTNDEEVWKRTLMYHDVIAPLQNGFSDDDLLIGTNYRMPELLGAVGLVQLRRLDGLLFAMRTRKRILKQGMSEVAARKGIHFREEVDEEGDAAVAMIFYVENAHKAGEVVQALRAENISATRMYEPNVRDYHVYAHWTPILEQRTWASDNGPWQHAQRDITYSKDMCPRSLDLLGRAVHLDVSPLLTNEDVEETIEGLNRVLDALT